MKILITGATGKVGSRLARHLADAGHRVRALVRRAHAAAPLETRGVEVALGDVTAPESLPGALSGTDVVLHCAAFFRGATPEQMSAVNVDGTVNLARAAVREGATKLVFLSTGLVFGAGPGRPATEDDPPAPASPYPRSKLAAERALLDMPDLDLRILRLAFVYGDGDSHLVDWLPQLRSWPTSRRLQLVHHRDIAGAVDALIAGGAKHRIYNLADDEALSAGAVLDVLREPAPVIPDPSGEVPFQGVMDASRIREELGFRCVYPSLRTAVSDAAH